ncbi:MAG: hypothetical protein AB7U95_35885 [Reyranella sp.]
MYQDPVAAKKRKVLAPTCIKGEMPRSRLVWSHQHHLEGKVSDGSRNLARSGMGERAKPKRYLSEAHPLNSGATETAGRGRTTLPAPQQEVPSDVVTAQSKGVERARGAPNGGADCRYRLDEMHKNFEPVPLLVLIPFSVVALVLNFNFYALLADVYAIRVAHPQLLMLDVHRLTAFVYRSFH